MGLFSEEVIHEIFHSDMEKLKKKKNILRLLTLPEQKDAVCLKASKLVSLSAGCLQF